MPSLPPARVGIVVRTKNRPRFLRRALADVAAQRFDDWQVHVVNDGGDATAVDDVIAALPEATRDRVLVTHHDTPRGRSAAANVGVGGLDTEFVVLHDDDDQWAPDFLHDTVAWLDVHPEDVGVMVRIDIVYEVERNGGYVEVDRARFWPQVNEITYSDLLQENRAVPIGYLYRRAIHAELGDYREDLHAVEDWEFYLRTTLKHHIGLLDGPPLAFWMQRVAARGEEGNSMFALADEHERYDKLVRDEALRAYVAEFGPGLPLYLTRYIQDEVQRQLAERRSVGAILLDRARRWRHRRRSR